MDPPKVEESKCNGCGLCVTVCPSFVLEMRNKKAEVVRGAWCIGCDHCGAVCPTEAILHRGASSKRESHLETIPVAISGSPPSAFSGKDGPFESTRKNLCQRHC